MHILSISVKNWQTVASETKERILKDIHIPNLINIILFKPYHPLTNGYIYKFNKIVQNKSKAVY